MLNMRLFILTENYLHLNTESRVFNSKKTVTADCVNFPNHPVLLQNEVFYKGLVCHFFFSFFFGGGKLVFTYTFLVPHPVSPEVAVHS